MSASALTAMLPGVAGSLAATATATAEPLRITHRMIDRGLRLAVEPGTLVRVCENPAVLSEAVDRLGDRCPPIVCTEGMPAAVTGRVLMELRAGGAVLAVHTDFDFGGIAIASMIIQRFGARPWRMGADDYVSALGGPTLALDQTIRATPWDPALAVLMNAHRRAVHEEAVLNVLVGDL